MSMTSIDHVSPSRRGPTGMRRGVAGTVITTAFIAFFFLLREYWALSRMSRAV